MRNILIILLIVFSLGYMGFILVDKYERIQSVNNEISKTNKVNQNNLK